jgi:hypothetical protein
MLVYGDPKCSVRLGELIENCGSRIRRMNVSSLDDLRSVLIFVGQLEQAVSDHQRGSAGGRELEIASIRLTDCLARRFCRKFIRDAGGDEKGVVSEALDGMAQILAGAPALRDELVTLKIPEGYAFYALFPEQYCVTALNWARQRKNGNEALVVGLRSIGTSLSAVVKETLCQMGWNASRFTVRPNGHPFQRRSDLNGKQFAIDVPVLIVDEGPGISGSSMAAVAEAFIAARCPDVSFFPGHSNGPSAPCPTVREVWRHVPRYVTPVEKVKWDGIFLEESLLAGVKELGGGAHACEKIQNISGGLWQKLMRTNEVEWPTSPPQFERAKFLCTGRNECPVLWKFAGVHSGANGADAGEVVLARVSRLASAGYCPEPLGVFRGFIAMPWLNGDRFTRADSDDPVLLRRIGNYIVAAAQPGLTEEQNKTAIERIAEMLFWNTKESLGEMFAQKALPFKDAAFEGEVELMYGDGHLAPHEWIRIVNGTIFKLDAEGHSADHTLIGEQSVLWDIAGSWIEWDLNVRTAVSLVEAIEEKGIRVNLEALAFYRAAYSAFRVGLFSMGLKQASDAEEKRRFEMAHGFYLRKLAEVLKAEVTAAQSAC